MSGFYEDDQPVGEVVEAFERGQRGVIGLRITEVSGVKLVQPTTFTAGTLQARVEKAWESL